MKTMTPTPDDLYSALLAAHEGLSPDQSAALDARLILLLIDALGDTEQTLALLEKARTTPSQ